MIMRYLDRLTGDLQYCIIIMLYSLIVTPLTVKPPPPPPPLR